MRAVAGGDEGGGGGETNVAGEREGETGARRRPGQGRDGWHRDADQDAGEGALALLEFKHRFAGRAIRAFAGAALAAHALDVAARAEGGAGTRDDERTDGRVVSELQDHAAKGRRQLVGEGVAGLRTIEGQGRHSISQLPEQQLRPRLDHPARSCHGPLPPSMPDARPRRVPFRILPAPAAAARAAYHAPPARLGHGPCNLTGDSLRGTRAWPLTKLSRPRRRGGVR